mgnify:CR=1 FL=1
MKCRIVLCGFAAGWLALDAVAEWGAAGGAVAPEEVVQAILEHSYTLRGARQETVARDARARQAKAQGLPSLDVRAQASRYTGLEDSALGEVVIPAVETRYAASIGLAQPLFTGGRVSGGRRAARYEAAAAREELRATEADATIEALTAYWNWSKAHYLAEALEVSVQRMETHARDVANLHESGLATESEKVAAEVLLDQTRLRLEEARNRVHLLKARIGFLAGRDLSGSAVPRRANAADAGTAAFVSPEEAIEARPEAAARELEVKSSESAARAQRADFYPQLTAVARYEQAHPNPLDFPPAEEWNDDAFVGVTLSWSLLDWGLTRGRAAEASARAEQARLRRDRVREWIALQLREARINFEDAASRLDVAARAARSAELNLNVAKDLWGNGLARHADVLDALGKLTDAQFAVTAAEADLVLARAELDYAAGALTGEGGDAGEP